MIAKLLSGRYILTVICAIVFAYGAISKVLPVDATISILMMVFTAYFNRTDRKQPNGGTDEQQK
jgi:hypothetical protein